MRSQGGIRPIRPWRVLKFILIACLVLVALPNTVLKSFPKVACKPSVLAGHTSYNAHERGHSKERVITPDFVTLAELQSRLGHVMEDSASSTKVAVNIKDSEMALRDLATLKSDIKAFVGDAKAAGGNLQQFGGRIWGAVDRIVSLNKRTLIILENPSTAEGDITAYHTDMEAIWRQGLELLDKTLRKLIHEAQDNFGSLQRLEERLNNIEDMVSAEKHKIFCQEQELNRQWFRRFRDTSSDP
ncbi:unnamed protein product [Rhizoctonia solani]|uniref:Uncharacterized protein n=1 Tax=Rhizoctonia solani TaxID=456999 RepID=A0A8H3E8K4_9AGAM|nr:unnamed protein product [Rhizoctonia solani]